MKNMIKVCATLAVALPLLAHAADGAEAAKHFQERNKAFFAQQAKDRAASEIRGLQATNAETAK